MIEVSKAIDKLVKRQDNQISIEKQRQYQRRNTVSDSKADFQSMLRDSNRLYTGFSISKDMQFIMRYTFSLHIRPFVTTFNSSIITSDTQLNISNNSISPNPHNHSAEIGIKVSEQEFDTSKIRVKINGIDITNAIILEYGSFVDGFGYFPKEDGEVFDILRLIEYFSSWEQAVILSHGRKEIELSQDENSLCECDISYHVKFNHIDRGGLY
ncbi:MAG: putative capsid protein [Caudoviricetes sp.]|nr:MAG: putative capsid protein [Caudoviricetes sp.]